MPSRISADQAWVWYWPGKKMDEHEREAGGRSFIEDKIRKTATEQSLALLVSSKYNPR